MPGNSKLAHSVIIVIITTLEGLRTTLAASGDQAAIVFNPDRKGNLHKHREEEAGRVCHEQPE